MQISVCEIIRKAAKGSLKGSVMDNLDLSAITGKLQVIIPYLSYIVNFFTRMVDMFSEYFK